MKVAFVFLNREQIASRGAGHIASSVMAAGHDLKFFDTAYTPMRGIVDSIVSGGYDILLISATTIFYEAAKRLATEIKQTTDLPILLGGVHATIVQGEILEECPNIDYICVGEGEGFIVEFLEAIANDNDVNSMGNLGYRNDSGLVVVNSVRSCTDLSSLPLFRHDIFDPKSIVQPGPLPGICYVYATRGCPYNCSYCCNDCYLKLYHRSYLRTGNIDAIITELTYLKKHYPVQFFFFGDEMILFNEPFVMELFQRIKSEIGLPYGCMARVERITPSIIELFRETGCQYVGMGVECGDENFRRDFLNRHMTNKQIVDAFAALRAIEGMKLTSYNMTGYPVSYDDALTQATKDLNKVIRPDILQMSVFFPFRGTKLYDYCVERDLINVEKVKKVEDIFSASVIQRAKL